MEELEKERQHQQNVTMCVCFLYIFSVISHDLHGCWAIIVNECRRVQVYINTSLIEPFEGRLNVLYQFVGEVESGNTRSQVSKRFLKARSYRCVEGLDLVKYYRAADARSTYLQGRSSSN